MADSARDAHLQKQAWDYFALHAQQRLTTLNFYVILSTALTTAIITSYQKDFRFPFLRFPASILLALFSFVFWRLDLRNRELIKSAESALRVFENASDWADLPAECLFSIEHKTATTRRETEHWYSRFWPRSYSHAFEFLFVAFLIVGLAPISITLIRTIMRALPSLIGYIK